MTHAEIVDWLKEDRPEVLARLWQEADTCRRSQVGSSVHLRGLIEISNYCRCNCWYCGLRAERRGLSRYRMNADQIFNSAAEAVHCGCGTIVLQAGEDPGLTVAFISGLIRRLKDSLPVAVTLSFGEQPEESLLAWKDAGADRYLLKVETTDEDLLPRIHPGTSVSQRQEQLARLRDLGYEIGSGIMLGIPGQTLSSVARDLEWFRDMDLDMVAVGPCIPHPETPLAAMECATKDQVLATAELTDKVIALSRLLCPKANIPATAALSVIEPNLGRRHALQRGANVIMPNFTPEVLQTCYDIYPSNLRGKNRPQQMCHEIVDLIHSLGQEVGKGHGGRLNINSYSERGNRVNKMNEID